MYYVCFVKPVLIYFFILFVVLKFFILGVKYFLMDSWKTFSHIRIPFYQDIEDHSTLLNLSSLIYFNIPLLLIGLKRYLTLVRWKKINKSPREHSLEIYCCFELSVASRNIKAKYFLQNISRHIVCRCINMTPPLKSSCDQGIGLCITCLI